MSDFFDSVLDFFFQILDFFHTILEPVFREHSWGWSIVALTLLVRILLLPLAIKQTRSMRAMQAIQPQIKELQKKYKVDRELMKKDPETYRARRQKLSEEQMALFKREGANPAASCLPLLAQAPIFIALFWTLQRRAGEDLAGQPFYFFTNYVPEEGLTGVVSAAGWPGWLLIVLMSGSMFITQRQMMARNAAMGSENPMAQQQKILMYVMPVFLAFISFNFPLGILLYWVTTNVWQIGQQWIILREVQHETETGEIASKPGGGAAARRKGNSDDGSRGESTSRRSPGASSGKKPVTRDSDDAQGKGPPSGEAAAVEDGSKDQKSKKGQSKKGQSKKGQSKKGQSKKGQSKKGRADGASAEAGVSKDTTSGSPNGDKPKDAEDRSGHDNGNGERGSADETARDATSARSPRGRDHLPRRRGNSS